MAGHASRVVAQALFHHPSTFNGGRLVTECTLLIIVSILSREVPFDKGMRHIGSTFVQCAIFSQQRMGRLCVGSGKYEIARL